MLSLFHRGVSAEPTPQQFCWLAALGTPLTLILVLPPFNLWPLAFVALVPLFALTLNRSVSTGRSATVALVAGALYSLVMAALASQFKPLSHPWLATFDPRLGWAILVVSGVVLGLLTGLGWTMTGVVLRRLRQHGMIATVVLGSATWVTIEILRTALMSGIPFVVGYSLPAATPFGQLASVGGVWLVSFGLVAVNLLFAEHWSTERPSARWPRAALGFLGVWFVIGSALWLWSGTSTRSAETVRAVAVQRSRSSSADIGDPLTYDQYLLTKQAGQSIVVLPEVSYAIDAESRQRMNQRPQQLVYSSLDTFYAANVQKLLPDTTLIAGFVDTTDQQHWRNSAALISGRGQFATTTKRELAPFGEVLPLARFWATAVRDQFRYEVPLQHQRMSTSYGILDVLFCNEALAPGLARLDVRAGAPFIPIIASNVDVPSRFYADWQLRAASYRAVETGRSVVLAADQTRSAIIRPTGTTIAVADYASTGAIDGHIPLRHDRTLWVQFASVWSVVLLIVTLATVMLCFRRSEDR